MTVHVIYYSTISNKNKIFIPISQILASKSIESQHKKSTRYIPYIKFR